MLALAEGSGVGAGLEALGGTPPHCAGGERPYGS